MSATPSRYTAEIDPAGVNDTHVLALGRIPNRSRVLDLGCADGSVAATLRKMGCRVWGVEADPTAANAAREVCEQVVEADLQQLDLARAFAGQRFDVVLLLDVLEHLAEPAALLSQVETVLEREGWAVISLPNVAHVSVRLSLLDGRFRYSDVGLLDRTHLRFFDYAGVQDLLARAAWSAFDVERVTRQLGETEISVGQVDPELVARLRADPEAATYQFVVTAAPAGWPAAENPPLLPGAVAQRLVLDAARRGAPTAPAITDLAERLEPIRQGSIHRRGHLGALLEALEENTERLRRTLPS